DARLGERREHPAVPAGEHLLIAGRPDSLRAHSVELALCAEDELAMRVDVAHDVEDVLPFPVPALGAVEEIAEDLAVFLADDRDHLGARPDVELSLLAFTVGVEGRVERALGRR